jgi:hypothetical protein
MRWGSEFALLNGMRRMEGIVVMRSFTCIRAIVLSVAAAAAMTVPGTAASAEGLFDFLFGGFRRSLPSSASAYSNPNPQGAEQRAVSGGAVAYCVRLCDGRFFPIQRTGGADPAQLCSSFCPAAKTKIFSGSSIDHAAARDGTHYTDLRSAFAYRERMIPDCTCDGKDSAGLVTTPTAEDPTLRAGDIVATESGFVAYTGNKGIDAQFTPISGEMQARLAGVRIVPADSSPAPLRATLSSDGPALRVQASR